MTFGFVPLTLMPMAATGVSLREVVIALAFAAVAAAAVAAATAVAVTGVPPEDEGMALAFTAIAAAAAALMFGGGEVGICTIVAWLRESWGLINVQILR